MDTKLAFIVCDQGVEPDVLGALDELGLPHYTRWTDCSGSGETGVREGSAIWPGLNSVIMVLMPAAKVDKLAERLHVIRDSFTVTPGLKIMVADAVML